MSSLASHRRALDEIESNFKEFATLRTKELKGNAADLQSEWREAKEEFSDAKHKLIDHETKKRMFEEAWNDQFEIEPSEQAKLNEEAKKKKEALQALKAGNQSKREELRAQAEAFAQRLEAQRAQIDRASAQIGAQEAAHAAAHEEAALAGQARQKLAETEANLERAEANVAELQRRLDAARAQSAQLARTTAGAEKERAEAEERLAAAERHATSLASVEGERAAWYAHVTAVMKKLSGLDAEWINSSTLQYTFATAGGGDVQLIVMFDAAKGTLAAAQLSPPLVAIGDLEAHAVRINSVEFLVREARARLDDMTAPPPAPTPAAAASGGRVMRKTPAAASAASAAPLSVSGWRSEAKMPAPLVPPVAPASGRKSGRKSSPARSGARRSSPRRASAAAAAAPPVDVFMAPAADGSALPPPLVPTAADVPPTPMPVENLTNRLSMAPTPAGPAPPSGGSARSLRSASKAAAPAPTPVPGSGVSVRPVDTSALASARHERRRSRKSFTRTITHPTDAASLAARAGVELDGAGAKAAVALLGGGVAGSNVAQFSVTTVDGAVRARLMADGTVVGATGELIAYIEHDGTVGDAKQEYLGEVTAPGHGATDNMGYVTRPGADDDSKDELVALVDYGRGVVRDAQGSTVAEIGRGGDVLGHWGATCGRLDGFEYRLLRVAAAYLVLVDPAFVQGS